MKRKTKKWLAFKQKKIYAIKKKNLLNRQFS